MLFVTNCEVNKNLSLYSNSSHIECAAKTSAGLFNPGGTRRHPDGTPAASGDTPTASSDKPGKTGTHRDTAAAPTSTARRKAPSMHYRSLYLSF